MVKTIIWDYGGVIVDGHFKGLFQKLKQKYFIDPIKWNELVGIKNQEYDLGQITGDSYWSYFQELLKIDEPDILNQFLQAGKINQNILNLIKELKQNYEIILYSDNKKEIKEFLDKTLGLKNYFDKNLFSYEIGILKKDEKAFEELIKKFNLNPSECIFIDDNLTNCENARKKGIKSIQYKNQEQLINELKNYKTYNFK
jgi:putative hydrolase of the HAD superfamily